MILLSSLYYQVMKQLSSGPGLLWKQTGPGLFLWLSIALVGVNSGLEAGKWRVLNRAVLPISFAQAWASCLVGIACSLITPNRVGDYPGRILYLGKGNTLRYINIAIVGAVAQLSAIFFFGLAGLIYYNIHYSDTLAKMAMILCIAVNIFLIISFFRFETWLPILGRIPFLRRFSVYGRLLNRVDVRQQLSILLLSLLRFAVFTAQYLFLLRWMSVSMPLADGFCMSALFFWAMAVIPSFAFTGLVARVQVSEYLFHHFSPNTIGIMAATSAIWLLNLVVPAIAGSLLIVRMKLIR